MITTIKIMKTQYWKLAGWKKSWAGHPSYCTNLVSRGGHHTARERGYLKTTTEMEEILHNEAPTKGLGGWYCR
jgi:hypothetical protein